MFLASETPTATTSFGRPSYYAASSLGVYNFETRLLQLDSRWLLPTCALEPLQRVLRAAIRHVAGHWPRDHVTEYMKELHWLPTAYRIRTLMHGAFFGQNSSYIHDLSCLSLIYQDAHGFALPASDLNDVSYTRMQFGRRAFSIAAPSEWNSLPGNLRLIADMKQFKRSLKTNFFIKAFG